MEVVPFTWLWLCNISVKAHQESDKPLLELTSSKNSLLLAGLLPAGYLVKMGFAGGLNSVAWDGGTAPISAVAFIVYLLGTVIGHLAAARLA